MKRVPAAATAASCPARAALAGNPSDGHGGAVVATVVSSVVATVTIGPSDRFEIAGTDLSYGSLDELDERVDTEGCGAIQPLVPAAIVVLRRHLDAEIEPARIAVSTTIPRSVGLAGSSAIVIATMRALTARQPETSWATRLADDPSLLASLALEAERDVLGIAAGLQDRVVQSFGGTVAMEFGEQHQRTVGGLRAGTYERLGALPGPCFVACRPTASGDSGAVHSGIDASDPAFVAAMRASADQARRAAAAIAAGDRVELGGAMDATFDLRASVMDLDRAHVEMVDLARSHGASANYTGSGGAVVVLAPDDASRERLRTTMATQLGCTVLDMA